MGLTGKLTLFVIAIGVAGAGHAAPKRKAMKAVPIGDAAAWFSPDDYPAEAVRSERAGRVVAAVGVDSTGKVVSCSIEVSSGTTALDTRTCELAMRHGLFNPATDGKGRSIASVYLLPVRWELPDDGASPPPVDIADKSHFEMEMETELTVDASGKLIACRVITANPRDSMEDPCSSQTIGTAVLPPIRRGGEEVSVKLVQRFTQRLSVQP